jgi:predicted XRE-type DNA-binding protein
MSTETDSLVMDRAAAESRRHIAQAVNAHLQTAGISQRAAAEQTGIPMTSFVRRITGRQAFDVDQLAKIAALLDVSVAALITYAEHTEAVVA